MVIPIHLPAVLFTPSENPALAIAATHEGLDVLSFHALGLFSVSNAVGVLEVYPMFMKKMQPLLFIVCREGLSRRYWKW